MPLATMMTLDGRGGGVALYACVLGEDRGLPRPFVGAVPVHGPLGEAIHHWPHSGLVTAPPFPGESLSRRPSAGVPEPQVAPLGRARVPQLIAFQGACAPRRRWRRLRLLGEGPDPVEYGLGRHPQEERKTVHRDATQLPQHSVELRGAGLAAWGGTRTRVATAFPRLLGLTGSGAMVDDLLTVTFGACRHRLLRWRKFPTDRWRNLAAHP